MSYVSNTDTDRREMLQAIGVDSIAKLISPIPESIQLQRPLNLPPRLDEMSLVRHLHSLATLNTDLEANLCFLGAGIYDHFRPSVINALISRGEFATAYTPYQPELSQGILQAMYEYQTLICALTGMDISNSSMYDAATGLAEAALMACDHSDRSEVMVLSSVNPHYRQVIATYLQATGYTLVETPEDVDADTAATIKSLINSNTACVIFQQPNFLGTVENMGEIVEITHSAGALAISAVDPISLGLLKTPGECDVDIVVGEGQSLGNPMGFGGPLLGFFACKKQFIRSFPGRIVGATTDQQGRRGYTMTLRTREQDIRREKATSNICTNEALLALAATIYLCELGKTGLRKIADLCLQKSHYACNALSVIPGVSVLISSKPYFKEFVLRLPKDPSEVNRELLNYHIVGGLPLGAYYPACQDCMLFCVTETKTKSDIDLLVSSLSLILGGP